MFDLWSKLMKCLDLEELTFSEMYDKEKAEDGRRLFQIGNI
jgi:hypothetical protein